MQVILSNRYHDVDSSVSCYYMTSLNYGGKKARDVGLTFGCHLSNIVPDSIFYDSMGWRITCSFFLKGDYHCLPQHKRDGFSCLIIITPMGLGKPLPITH